MTMRVHTDKRAVERAMDKARRAVSAGAIYFQGEAKKTLSASGRGRKHSGLNYRSSKPGDPPTVQTGTLRRSIQSDLSQANKGLARVGTNIKYASYLEWGTRNMAPRPFMRPTLKRSRSGMMKAIRREAER